MPLEPDDERTLDEDEEVELPDTLHEADPEKPEADALEQALPVPLEEDDEGA